MLVSITSCASVRLQQPTLRRESHCCVVRSMPLNRRVWEELELGLEAIIPRTNC
jgi:hypothetical protein